MEMLTDHAAARLRQRGLRERDLTIIQELGEPVQRPGGAIEYRITNAAYQREAMRLKRRLQKLDQLRGTAVLMGSDGTIITAYHLIGRRNGATR